MYCVTIDAGKTNTWSGIWKNDVIVAEATATLGVRDTAIDGNNLRLTEAIAATVKEAVKIAGIQEAK